MGKYAAGDPQLETWDIPLDGLHFILSGWSGQGRLFTALAAVSSDVDIQWSDTDVRARAMRMVVESVRPSLGKWPMTVDEWLAFLPVSSIRENAATLTPNGRIDWLATTKRFGWPPSAYVTSKRSRNLSDRTIEVLAWTVEKLKQVVTQVQSRNNWFDVQLDNVLGAAVDALGYCATPEKPTRPDFQDLKALASGGSPWTHVRDVAQIFLRSETDIEWFATQMLMPDDELRWRLFHLAVTGSVLKSLQGHGFTVDWNAPLGADRASGRPTFSAVTPELSLDVWFESQTSFRVYSPEVVTPYQNATAAVRKRESSIGADIALYDRETRSALLIECKFGQGPYVARAGFHQACGYLLDHSMTWDTIWSFVVGPKEVVRGESEIDLSANRKIGFANPSDVNTVIERFVDRLRS